MLIANYKDFCYYEGATVRCLWKVQDFEPETVEKLAAQLGVTQLAAQCLYNRGCQTPETAKSFLEPFLRNLSNPFDIPQMDRAVERLIQARQHQEPVTIFGDYDVDGITATALLVEFFNCLGWNCMGSFLPLRMEDGYGLSDEGVDHCMAQYPGTRILLAVDCGSTSAKSIQRLQNQGVDVIVLDHHQIDETEKPSPVALVNPRNISLSELTDPKREQEILDLQNLCSAGLAFKLAHALLKQGRELNAPWGSAFDLKSVLDLVAMGTIADLVKLQGENRIFVSNGLKCISQTQRPGLQELVRISQRKSVTVYDVSFYLAPRLNAAGRLEDAQVALKLLTTKDRAVALQLALQLDQVNQARKGLQNRIAEEVIERVRRNFNPEEDYVIVEGNFEWHLGVIGIAAAQVTKQFHRPVIILGGNGQNWRGSCRSIEGFDMASALRECEDLLLSHGGHSMAAGVEVELNKLEAFRKKINEVARRSLENKELRRTLLLDAIVHLKDMRPEIVNELFRLAPFGMGNSPLLFGAKGVRQVRPARRFGQMQRHLKLFMRQEDEPTIEGVIWNCEDEPPSNCLLDIVFEPTLDCFNNQDIVRLRIQDWRISEEN